MAKAPVTATHDEMLAAAREYYLAHNELLIENTDDPDDWGTYVCYPWTAVKVIFPENELDFANVLRLFTEANPTTLVSSHDHIYHDESLLSLLRTLLHDYFITTFMNMVDADPELMSELENRHDRAEAYLAALHH